jgi:hypothetical protein
MLITHVSKKCFLETHVIFSTTQKGYWQNHAWIQNEMRWQAFHLSSDLHFSALWRHYWQIKIVCISGTQLDALIFVYIKNSHHNQASELVNSQLSFSFAFLLFLLCMCLCVQNSLKSSLLATICNDKTCIDSNLCHRTFKH